jgi:lysylphosphatidylglycerol synthetase-like protein (DUF2156 family)
LNGATAAPASQWRAFATAAYFLAVLVVLDPGIGFVFGAWPPNPSLLPWRHISSGLLIVAAPMIGAAAVGILLAARVRGDEAVLKLLRLCGLIALVLGVPFTVLYAVDSTKIYGNLPAAQARSFVAMETRMFTLLAIGLPLLWMLSREPREAEGG